MINIDELWRVRNQIIRGEVNEFGFTAVLYTVKRRTFTHSRLLTLLLSHHLIYFLMIFSTSLLLTILCALMEAIRLAMEKLYVFQLTGFSSGLKESRSSWIIKAFHHALKYFADANLSNVFFFTGSLNLFMFFDDQVECNKWEIYSLANDCQELFWNIIANLQWVAHSLNTVANSLVNLEDYVFWICEIILILFY